MSSDIMNTRQAGLRQHGRPAWAPMVLAVPLVAALAACGTSTTAAESPDAGVTAQHASPAVIEDSVTICNSTTSYAPMYWEENGDTIGIEIELAKALADHWGVELDLNRMAFEGLFPAMDAQRCQFVVAGLLITESRLEGNDAVAYLSTGPAIVTSTGIEGSVKEPEDLSSLTLAVQQGTGQEDQMEALNEEFAAEGIAPIDLQVYPDTSSAVQAVMAGHADAFVETKMVASYIADQRDELVMAEDVFPDNGAYGIFLPQDSPLTDTVHEAVVELAKNGTLEGIVEKYGVDGTQVINPDEWEFGDAAS